MKNILLVLLLLLSIKVTAQVIKHNTEFQIDSTSSSDKAYPVITELSNGGFVVVWVRAKEGQFGTGIFGEVYNSDFSLRREAFQINTNLDEAQNSVLACSLPDGGFIVVWEAYSWGDNSFGWSVLGRAFNSDLTPKSDEFMISVYEGSAQRHPSVECLNDGKIVVAWDVHNGGFESLRIRVFNSDFTPFGEELKYYDAYDNPKISKLSDGGFLVFWKGMEGQIFNSDLSKRGEKISITSQTIGSQEEGNVTTLLDGKIVIAWQDFKQDGSSWGIFGRAYNSDLSTYGEEFKINTYTISQQKSPSIHSLLDSGFVVVWESFEQNNPKWGIYGQVYNSDFTLRGEEFLITSTNTTKSYGYSSVCSIDDDKFAIVYQGEINGETKLFGKYYLNKPIDHELNIFNLETPKMDSIVTELNPLLKWETPTDIHLNYQWEIKYDLYLSKNEEFDNPIKKGITELEYKVSPLLPNQTYFWKVLAKNYYGDSLWSSNVNGFYIDPSATVGISEAKNELLKNFSLSQNYPNPFNPTTKIKYTIPVGVAFNATTTNVLLKVYDVLGKEVVTLVNKEQSVGSYEVKFNGSSLSSGVYFYKITIGPFSKAMKMVLSK